MSRAIAVLRPEPGNTATAAAIEALGLTAIRLPLFEVHAVDWAPPDVTRFDALLLTSANTPRHAGPGLATLRGLPTHAVGDATAAAARDAGLEVVAVGDRDGAALVAAAAASGVQRALLLGGRDRAVEEHSIIAEAIAVYASEPVAVALEALDQLAGSVVLLHSARAARRVADLIDRAGIDRRTVRLAAISAVAADAAGGDWEHIAAAPSPDGVTLIALARTLAD
jgi:uroporphyrinogen-III synthase